MILTFTLNMCECITEEVSCKYHGLWIAPKDVFHSIMTKVEHHMPISQVKWK